ncbi:MAG: hypothetical protein BYD32DRAFT_52166 [Podila humilis]|nr:MAG: hypothetical protein BYD32DRAFT_52166 [Podila humilis]
MGLLFSTQQLSICPANNVFSHFCQSLLFSHSLFLLLAPKTWAKEKHNSRLQTYTNMPTSIESVHLIVYFYQAFEQLTQFHSTSLNLTQPLSLLCDPSCVHPFLTTIPLLLPLLPPTTNNSPWVPSSPPPSSSSCSEKRPRLPSLSRSCSRSSSRSSSTIPSSSAASSGMSGSVS